MTDSTAGASPLPLPAARAQAPQACHDSVRPYSEVTTMRRASVASAPARPLPAPHSNCPGPSRHGASLRTLPGSWQRRTCCGRRVLETLGSYEGSDDREGEERHVYQQTVEGCGGDLVARGCATRTRMYSATLPTNMATERPARDQASQTATRRLIPEMSRSRIPYLSYELASCPTPVYGRTVWRALRRALR